MAPVHAAESSQVHPMYSICSDAVQTRFGPITVARAEETASTSRDARMWVEAGGASGARVFVADRQTGGVGRLGRRWESPLGGLWMTLAWPLRADRWEAVVDGLGLRVGAACVRVIRRGAAWDRPERVVLKWPNDVLVDGRKVCGALVQVVVDARGRRWALTGVGVNANFAVGKLPEALRGRATTLLDAAGGAIDLGVLRDDLIVELCGAASERGLSAPMLAEVRAMLAGVGERATVALPDGSSAEGTLRGIDDSGRALLELPDGRTLALASGEVCA